MLDTFGRYFVYALAVCGAYFVGSWGAGLLLTLAARFFLGKPPPPKMYKLFSQFGGAAAAIGAFVLLFGGLSPGGWFGGGRGDAPAPPSSAAPAPKDEPPEPPKAEPPPKDEPPEPAAVVIRMLGGARVVEGKFYLPQGGEPLTLDALRERLRADPPSAGRDGRRRLDILIDDESVAYNHPAVKALEDWARFEGYAVQTRRRGGP